MFATDGFRNFVSNLATERDKASANTWFVQPRTSEQFEAMYRGGWIGRKIIDIPVDDMIREWRVWSADDDLVDAISEAENRFGVREKVASAKRWARLYGSSAIIIGMNSRLGKSEEPVDTEKVSQGDLEFLHVEIAPRIRIESWNTNLESPDFGRPLLYSYQPYTQGGGAVTPAKIHASRVIQFSGAPLPPLAHANGLWGDSIFMALEQTLGVAGSITAVIASLLHEAKTDIIKIKDLASYLGSDTGTRKVTERFNLAAILKSVNNALVLDAEEDFQQKTFSFTGLSDIHIRIMQEVAGAADIPVTRLLGQSPAGLQSTGESDLRNYYDSIGAKQELELRPVLDRLDRLVLASAGITLNEDAKYRFTPLWRETPKDRADNALKKAQAAKTLVDAGLIDDVVLAKGVLNQMIEDGVFPGLDAAIEEEGGEGIKEPVDGDANPGNDQGKPGVVA